MNLNMALLTIIITLATLLIEFLYMKFYDNEDTKSMHYIYFSILSFIPFVNLFTLVIGSVLLMKQIVLSICGPGLNYVSFKLDRYRSKNKKIRLNRNLTIKNENELLKSALIELGIFKSRYEVREFLEGFKTINKLNENQ